MVSHTNPSSTQKGFASGFGYQEDGESGYKLLGHRYYDPDTGRFLSQDPVQDGRNWYSYVDNSPLKSIDSEGLKKKMYIITGYLTGQYDIRDVTKLLMYLMEMYGDEYDIEIKGANDREEFIQLMSQCDAAICIGHGGDFSTKHGVIQAGDILEIARRRRRLNKSPLDFIILFSCNCFPEGALDAEKWWKITNRVAGYAGSCYPCGNPKRAYEGLTWFQKPGTGEDDLPKWTEVLPKKQKPTRASGGHRRVEHGA